VNKRERRVVEEVCGMLQEAGSSDGILETLQSLLRKSGPTKLHPPIVRSFSHEKAGGVAIPKKKRFVSRKNIEAYKATHSVCEVCGAEPMADPHHLLAVSLLGPDKEQNLIRLCWNHHIGPEGFHTLGMWRWFELVKKHVDTDALDKILYRLSLGKHVNDLE